MHHGIPVSYTHLTLPPEEQAQRNAWERAAKIDYYSHTPNRIVKWILGDKMYEKVKKLFKR